MMKVWWEEWRGGNAFASLRLLPPLALAAALGLLITQFHPGTVFLVLTTGALVGGALSGTQRWNRLLARDWVGLEGLAPLSYALGKTTGLLSLLILWAVFLLPAFLIAGLPWGLPWQTAAQGLAWVTVGMLVAQSLGQLVTWSDSEFQRVLGMILPFVWITATFQPGPLRAWNPLWQTWNLFSNPTQAFAWGAWLTLLGIAAALWVPVLLVLYRKEARR